MITLLIYAAYVLFILVLNPEVISGSEQINFGRLFTILVFMPFPIVAIIAAIEYWVA